MKYRWKLNYSTIKEELKVVLEALGISLDIRMHLRLILMFLGGGFIIFGLLLFSSNAGIILIALGIIALVFRFTFLRK
jgi:hypothetical protein